jgi:small nuclear ribonucleoprotein B and B'
MMQYLNWRMKVTVDDGRTMLGTLMAFDKYMNVVMSDTDEYRKVRGKKDKAPVEKRRALGFVIVRGETIISLQPDSPPAPKPRAAIAAANAAAARIAVAMGAPAGRGLGQPVGQVPSGLSGPVRGMGGPSASMMRPQGGIPMMQPPR